MFNKNKFKAAVLYAGKTYQDVADALGIHINTLYKRIQTGEFSRSEINTIMELLGLDSADDIFFDDEIAFTQKKEEA